MPGKIITVLLYFISGLFSSYLFFMCPGTFGSYVPGFLFISITVLIALVQDADIRLIDVLLYYIFSYSLYLLVFFGTFYSGTAGLLTGIFFTGLGAFGIFWLTNKYLRKIEFEPAWIFLLGSLCFVVTDLLRFPPAQDWLKRIYDSFHKDPNEVTWGVDAAFAPSFLLWQLIIGGNLALAMLQARETKPDGSAE